MADTTDTMMNPGVEELLERAGSKFSLVAIAAGRARGINTYYSQLGAAMSHGVVPPQVTSTAHKPLSIAFEEIAAGQDRGSRGRHGASDPRGPAADPEPDAEDVFGAAAEDASPATRPERSRPEGRF